MRTDRLEIARICSRFALARLRDVKGTETHSAQAARRSRTVVREAPGRRRSSDAKMATAVSDD